MASSKVLLLYKKSAYQIYFVKRKNSKLRKNIRMAPKEVARFKRSHQKHYQTLSKIEGALKELGIRYNKCSRGRNTNYNLYRYVITVGGDGTFLEAARQLNSQVILGINSDPKWSVGQFCIADDRNFKQYIKKLMTDRPKSELWPRIALKIGKKSKKINILNEVLVCHQNPAGMSRYYLSVNGMSEEQRCSGIWIAPAAGSTGAIRSAGGKRLAPTKNIIQYQPRELYRQFNPKYRLKGGKVAPKSSIVIKSLMRLGIICIDGAHYQVPFRFGQKAVISRSKIPLKVLTR